MTSYFRRAELTGAQSTEEQAGPGPLFLRDPKTEAQRDTCLKKRGSPPWNHRDQCQGSNMWPSGNELRCCTGNSWDTMQL